VLLSNVEGHEIWSSGINKISAIYADFRQKIGVFSDNTNAKNWRFSLQKTKIMIQFMHSICIVLEAYADCFANFCGENILEIITSVPGCKNTPIVSPIFVAKIF
jgi:hypothetical protein